MFPRSDDQQLLEETTRRFLDAECPPAKLRELADHPVGYEPGYWEQGAQLGWTSLVVPEAAGGGSVSGHGPKDLALVAYQFGLHAAPGPLIGTNVVAAALGRWGTPDQRAGPLAELLSGEATGAWALAEAAPDDGLGQVRLQATEEGGIVHLEGTKSPVEGGGEADYLLVTAASPSGPVHLLVAADAPGLVRTPMHGVDMTRRFAVLEFDGVRVPTSAMVGGRGAAQAAFDWLLDLGAMIQLAEMCGALRWAFDTTLEWAFARYSFGRPLASYQEIKHRFADMKVCLEASVAIADQAADAIDGDAPNRSELVSAGKFYVGRYGVELVHDCVQLHGGIGVTFDHDLHLFVRRVVTDTQLLGTPDQHAVRLTDILEARELAS